MAVMGHLKVIVILILFRGSWSFCTYVAGGAEASVHAGTKLPCRGTVISKRRSEAGFPKESFVAKQNPRREGNASRSRPGFCFTRL